MLWCRRNLHIRGQGVTIVPRSPPRASSTTSLNNRWTTHRGLVRYIVSDGSKDSSVRGCMHIEGSRNASIYVESDLFTRYTVHSTRYKVHCTQYNVQYKVQQQKIKLHFGREWATVVLGRWGSIAENFPGEWLSGKVNDHVKSIYLRTNGCTVI
jgi:hypothetical protein